jgi:hypothetical protein
MASKRARITLRCPADQYSGPGERIIEFSFPSSRGGLLAFKEPAGSKVDDGQQATIEIYRVDGDVRIVAPKRTYWAAFAGSAYGQEITLHESKRSALYDVVNSLGIDVLGRAEEDAREGEDEGDAAARVLDATDEETIVEWLDSYCSSRADDWHVNEVEV